MHAGRRYSLKEFLYWTRRDIYVLTLLAVIPTVLYVFLDWTFLGISYHLIAERERIIFEDYGIILGPQITYTVREDKPNSQVWEQYTNNPSTRKVIYLKRCASCEPYYPLGQFNSI